MATNEQKKQYVKGVHSPPKPKKNATTKKKQKTFFL